MFDLGCVFLIGFVAIAYFYWQSEKSLNPNLGFFKFLKSFLLYLSYSLGLSVHNTIAILEGYIGIKSPFIRTPKFNVKKSGGWKNNKYVKNNLSFVTILEVLCLGYFAFGIYLGIKLEDYALLLFHGLLVFGFGLILFESVKPMIRDN